ncbi:MAG: hypothetical protein U9R42_01075 [Bacteroidota bacterium]|nr:hypothetical protein [Bacteroidota bacterium]
MKKLSLLFFILLISFVSFSQNKDAFEQMMNVVGISEKNLGFEPKSYWIRYPNPSQIPFKNPAFDDLFREPQRIYDYLSVQKQSVENYLAPEYLEKHSDGLMKLGFYCGIMHQSTEFRAYSASLWAKPTEKQPMLNAIKDIYKVTHNVFEYNRIGKAGEYPLNEKDLKIALKNIHPSIQREVAVALINLTEAWRFTQIAMRNVDYKDAVQCWRIRHLGETQFDGMEYFPCLEDAAKDIDINSIYYAGAKLMAVAEELSDTLVALKNSDLNINWKNQEFNWLSPIGRIVISGTTKNTHRYSDAFLVIDLGGNDTYYGAIGSTPSLQIPVSLAIDLDGDDKYINDDEYLPSQGAGIFGAAMLYDLEGDDVYQSKRLSQGAAMLGIGILADNNGDDEYKMWTSGQGSAYFGVGLAIDNNGNDKYSIFGDGQGYGGVGGVGTLINNTGNDHYYAEKDTAVIFRIDNWHSHEGQYNYSYVQGSGVGRRGDVTDGHSWAGGTGTLIDISGDDFYEAGGWSQGCGYWYGSGYLYDGTGNDKYHSTHWSQAAGAHFCIGVLIDEGGNDEHVNWGKLAAGIGFGHDYTIAIFLNKGGNDTYKVHNDGFGYAINKSQVFFFDTEGDDKYITGEGHHYGWNNFDKQNPPGISSVYHLYSDQICFFADLKGKDVYLKENFETGKQSDDERMKDGGERIIPSTEEKEKLSLKRYYGISEDFKNYNGKEIEFFRNKLKQK